MEEDVKIFKNLSSYERKLIKSLMRSFSNILILWLINKKRMHGYEIMTELNNSNPYENKMPSTSKIYPVLHDLENNGLIKGSWEHQGKRKIKYYVITGEGKNFILSFKKLTEHVKNDHANLWTEFREYMDLR
ncbi:PadR family transcriptional regulator [Methanobacterium sp.]|uniref:PadR family transcriptional regulator n=1 Tax=Methanobacterium sp. TaxID=2164 RepID=UPI003C7245CE